MQLILPEYGISDGRLLLEKARAAGSSYRLQVQVCRNPVCECQHLTLLCFPEAGDLPDRQTAKPLSLEMDAGERLIEKPARGAYASTVALVKAVGEEITEAHWEVLLEYYLNLKMLYTEKANLDEIDAQFPPDTATGRMVGFYEILPFARRVILTVGGNEWYLEDQYCLAPDCTCQAANLDWSQLCEEAVPQGPKLAIRYDYASGQFEALESEGTVLSAQDFLCETRKIQPDLDAFLAKRHGQLRQLYRNFLARYTTPVRAAPKPGRNDPCPCGSGKKYKKCCGRPGQEQ